ncbi:hypothetical protein ABZ355_29960, partial [Streptomyces sp. NPDC005989]
MRVTRLPTPCGGSGEGHIRRGRVREPFRPIRRSPDGVRSDLRRDGMSLLLRGVQAALEPKGIAVEILKP